MAADLRPIYEAPIAEEAARRLDDFEGNGPVIPSIAPPGDGPGRGDPVLCLQRPDPEDLYNTNAVESLHRVLRKTRKTKFLSDRGGCNQADSFGIRNFGMGGRAVGNGLPPAIIWP